MSSASSQAPACVIPVSLTRCRFPKTVIGGNPGSIPARSANSAQRAGVISTVGSKALQGVSSIRISPSSKKKSRISSRDICWQVAPSRT